MQMQSDLKTISMKLLDLPLNKIYNRIGGKDIYSLKLRNLDEINETGVPLSEHMPESFCRFINQLSQRTRTVPVNLIIECEYAFDHVLNYQSANTR